MENKYIVIMVLGSVFVGYVVTSLILFRFPLILHRKKKLCFRPVHISHRGGNFTSFFLYVLYLVIAFRSMILYFFLHRSSLFSPPDCYSHVCVAFFDIFLINSVSTIHNNFLYIIFGTKIIGTKLVSDMKWVVVW